MANPILTAQDIQNLTPEDVKERVGRPYRMDAVNDPRDIHVRVQLPNGVFAAEVPRTVCR